MKGLGSGVWVIAIQYLTDAWRIVYVAELAGKRWVVHAFQKKSTRGIKTPTPEINLIKRRLAQF